jgi:hypothetical protein
VTLGARDEVAGGFRQAPVPQSRQSFRLQRPLIEPYVTFSVIRLSGSPKRCQQTLRECITEWIKMRDTGASRGAVRATPQLYPSAGVNRRRRDAGFYHSSG